MMAATIVKTEREVFPAMRLIGKRYTEADRVGGNFGAKWGEWFSGNLFAALEKIEPLPQNGDAYVGAMRVENGQVVYWIGMLFPAGTAVPDGYEYQDIEALDFGVCWVYGSEENGEIYGLPVHNLTIAAIQEKGWVRKEDDWCFERYNCPRFTTPDEKGNVILDYGVALI